MCIRDSRVPVFNLGQAHQEAALAVGAECCHFTARGRGFAGGFEAVWLASTIAPVMTTEHVQVLPSRTFNDPGPIDVLFVPGGGALGIGQAMFDPDYQGFLKRAAASAEWCGSVCTGAFVLAAARLLPEELTMPQLAMFVGWIPVLPYASALVTSEPLVWFLVSAVLSGVFLTMWAVAVRRVEIAPDAVRVWRGLRPTARVYPRPPYGMINRGEYNLSLIHISEPTRPY